MATATGVSRMCEALRYVGEERLTLRVIEMVVVGGEEGGR
jgi:hypothetical protein